MPDPVTWGVLGGIAAKDGITFLYEQASELLKAWRERRQAVAAGATPPEELTVPVVQNTVLDGEVIDPVADARLLDRESRVLVRLLGALSPYAQGQVDIEPADDELREHISRMRDVLEVVYGRRFTFRGEERDATGTSVHVNQVLGEVGGRVVGVDAEVAEGGTVDVEQSAVRVDGRGSVTGFQGRIG
ncbi:hypothetical protein [Streptomyces sp. CdTB01]|jgi:hypothetical protein|uniref:hypothetical protein n=1 Tax=Streptomyces sp. CdTB01 TaxID=1725411 RepID=UPI00073ACF94|nr:hypothetical protein [Streptomyces sp. CdTB01]ALV32234.1 hypothetical protein AS200_09400 [Streptomyces sp. CdTB01]